MSRWMIAGLLCLCLVLFACAGSTTPLTDYGYSSWKSRAGVNAKGEFKRARQECFDRHGIEEPAAVEKNSPLERRFAVCMRTKGWCSNTGSCH